MTRLGVGWCGVYTARHTETGRHIRRIDKTVRETEWGKDGR